MKVHAYKSHEIEDNPHEESDYTRVMVQGLCGVVTPRYVLSGSDVPKIIDTFTISMVTLDPGKVTCGSCLRSKTFPLFELASTEI